MTSGLIPDTSVTCRTSVEDELDDDWLDGMAWVLEEELDEDLDDGRTWVLEEELIEDWLDRRACVLDDDDWLDGKA